MSVCLYFLLIFCINILLFYKTLKRFCAIHYDCSNANYKSTRCQIHCNKWLSASQQNNICESYFNWRWKQNIISRDTQVRRYCTNLMYRFHSNLKNEQRAPGNEQPWMRNGTVENMIQQQTGTKYWTTRISSPNCIETFFSKLEVANKIRKWNKNKMKPNQTKPNKHERCIVGNSNMNTLYVVYQKYWNMP